jgi:hypothetical protein
MKRDYVFLANHNAYAAQQAALQFTQAKTAEIFNRKKQAWQALDVRDNTVRFQHEPGGGELLRFGK